MSAKYRESSIQAEIDLLSRFCSWCIDYELLLLLLLLIPLSVVKHFKQLCQGENLPW
jgi:hypothetical protein